MEFVDRLLPQISKYVPLTVKKNKKIAISTAIALYFVYWIRKSVLPPKHLRHIPHVSYLTFITSLINGDSYISRAKSVHLPFLYKTNMGMYLEPAQHGWEVIVSNPQDAKIVFNKNDLFPKSDITTKANDKTLFARFVAGPNILALVGSHWKSQRNLANPAFKRSMPVKLFGKLTQDLFQAMDEIGGTTFDMTFLIERWTLEAIGKAGFDFEFNGILDRGENKWIDTYNKITEGVAKPIYFFFPSLDQKYLWLNPERQKVHTMLDEFMTVIDDMINKKRASIQLGHDQHNSALAENERDLLTLLIEGEMRGDGAMTNEEIQSNVCLFFFAGHDTTTSALCSALYFLAIYPDIQEKARQEAIEVLSDEPQDVLPSVSQTKQMIYINQVIKETLRMVDPIPRVIPKIAQQDTVLSNVFIPKGTYVNVDMYDLHHNRHVWQDPEQFNPDRFATGGESESQSGIAWAPFGGGQRLCLGMNFSLNEQRVLLSMMLRKFTWTLPQDSIHKDGLITAGFPVLQATDLKIDFMKRY